MKGRLVALDRLSGRRAAAHMRDGLLDDLLIDGPAERPAPGTVFRAVTDRPMKGQGGVMLRLPDGRGFLRQTRGIAPGEPCLIQVVGYAREGKAVPVSARVALRGRYGVITFGAPGRNVSRGITDAARRAGLAALAAPVPLPEGAGLILRSACADAPDAEIARDLATLSRDAALVACEAAADGPARLLDGPDAYARARIDWPHPDTCDDVPGSFARHGIDAAIDALRMPRIPLPGGAVMHIEVTRALIAVDIDTGPDTSPAAGLKANIAAARSLPRELRCRGLGGQVVLDLAPSPRKDRHRIEQALQAAFRADPVDTVLAGWTPLGHYELQRKHARLPLTEALP